MAISKNTRNKFKSSNAAYNESNDVKNARSSLTAMSNQAPAYTNTYARQLKDIYGKILNGEDFNYSPENDVAYRRFADEYNALSGLAIAGNQQQAQNLTGGYGSTYAPEVANQGLARMKDNVINAQPYFLENAQQAYIAENDRLKNMYDAAAQARDSELDEFVKRSNAYNDKYSMANHIYNDSRNFDYTKYNDNRDFWSNQYNFEQQSDNFNKELSQKNRQSERDYKLNSYNTYEKIAATKASQYNDKKDNKGMKSYLNKLVKDGKITQYMADNIYNQYKYTPPKTTGSKRSNNGNDNNDTVVIPKNWNPNDNILKYINLHNRAETLETALNWIDALAQKGDISEEEKEYYKYYYENKFAK